MTKILKITDNYLNDPIKPTYLLTDLTKKEAISIISALQYFLDMNTKYAKNSQITKDMAIYLMCRLFRSKIITRDKIKTYDCYDSKINDIIKANHFDMVDAVSKPMTTNTLGVYKILEAFNEDEFLHNLCCFYDSPDSDWLIHHMSAEDIHYRP